MCGVSQASKPGLRGVCWVGLSRAHWPIRSGYSDVVVVEGDGIFRKIAVCKLSWPLEFADLNSPASFSSMIIVERMYRQILALSLSSCMTLGLSVL